MTDGFLLTIIMCVALGILIALLMPETAEMTPGIPTFTSLSGKGLRRMPVVIHKVAGFPARTKVIHAGHELKARQVSINERNLLSYE